MRALVPLTLVGIVAACQLKTPEQDHFTLRAGNQGIRAFVTALERRLGTTAGVTDLHRPESDATQMFELNAGGVAVKVVPVPDDRCDSNASMHSTYRQGEYRIDVIYLRSP